MLPGEGWRVHIHRNSALTPWGAGHWGPPPPEDLNYNSIPPASTEHLLVLEKLHLLSSSPSEEDSLPAE